MAILAFVLTGNPAVDPYFVSPVTLNDCIQMALSRSPYAIRYANDRAAARTDVLIAAGRLLPRLELASGYVKSGPGRGVTTGIDVPVFFAGASSSANSSTSITASADLLNVAAIAEFGQARQAHSQAEEAFRLSRADLVWNVKQAFLDLVQSQRTLAVAQSAVLQSREQANVAAQRFRLGSLSRPDLLPFEVTLSQSQTDQALARAGVVSAQQILAGFLGIQISFRVDTTLSFPDTTQPVPNEDSLVGAALRKNPAYRQAAAQVKIQDGKRQVVLGRHLPVLSASYTAGYADTTFFGGIGGANDFWNVQASLTWSFLDAAMFPVWRRAGQQIRSSEASRRIARNAAEQDMRRAVANLRAAREGLSTIADLLSQAEEDFRLQTERNRLGAAAVVDVLNSQVRFNQAQLQATQVMINYYLAQGEIRRILGEW